MTGNGEGTVSEHAATGNVTYRPGVSVSDAAKALGVSDRAIRARIKRGTLEAWRVQAGHGPEWRIDPDSLRSGRSAGTNGIPGTGTVRVDPGGHAAEAERLREEVSWLRGQLDAAARDRAALLAALEAQTRALEAQAVKALPAPDIPTGTSDQDAPAEPAQVDIQVSRPRPWWKFW